MSLQSLTPIWREVPFGQITTLIQYGLNASANTDADGALYLRISDIDDDGNAHIRNPKYVSGSTPGIEKYILEDGDILIARSGSVGRSFVYGRSERPWVFASYLIRFRLNQEVALPAYIGLFLRSPAYKQYVSNVMRSAAQPNINSKELAALKIPLPPLSEQRRIAALLREADELRRLRRKADDKAKQLYASLYFEMFGTGEPNKKHPLLVKLHTLLKVPISTGFSPNTSDEAVGLPVLTLSAITGSGLDETQVKYFSDENYQGKGSDLEDDDILITRSNTFELVGKVDRYRGKPKPVLYPDLVMRLRSKNKTDSIYLENALRNQHIIAAIRRLARGTSGSMKKISQGDVNNFDILWPHKRERGLFSKRVLGIDELRDEQKRSNDHLETLFASLIARTFTGELTATWREARDEQLREEAIQRDIALGLRGTEPTIGDLQAGRVTRVEQEEANRLLAQAIEQFRSIPSNAFQNLFTETFGDVAKINISGILQSNTQGIQEMQAEMQELLAAQMSPVSALLADQLSGLTQQMQSLHLESLSKVAFQPSPELSRQLAGWLSNIGRLGAVAEVLSSRKALRDALSEDLSTLIGKVAAAPPYFRPADLQDDEISLLQVEERLRLLTALGIVRPVTVQGQACYRLVSQNREHAAPEGLEP